MGNQLQGCCSDTKDTTNEISGVKKAYDDEESVERAKGGHTRLEPAAPYMEQSREIFENQEISDIKNHANDNNNINGNFNSENLDNIQKAEFKPDEALISNFLVGESQNSDVNLEKFCCDRVLKAKSTKHTSETYTQDFNQTLTNPEFNGDNMVTLPPVYVNKENKEEIYKGSWIVDNKETQEGGEINSLNSNMKFHGYGQYIKSDKTVQEGIFRYGELDGPGKTYVNNGDTFIGNYEKGMLNNKGVFVDYAGDIYQGEFKDNIMEGQGQETFVDGSAFTGEYKGNKKNGEGKFVWADGSFYKGSLKDNHFHGKGLYEWASGLKYDGQWEKGLMEGEGIITTKNGDYYEGEFKNNKKDGVGLFWWNERKYYLGNWKQGVQHGDGKFFKEGKLMVGTWMQGKFKQHKEIELINIPEKTFDKVVTFQ
jgi:hypothetical protein